MVPSKALTRAYVELTITIDTIIRFVSIFIYDRYIENAAGDKKDAVQTARGTGA